MQVQEERWCLECIAVLMAISADHAQVKALEAASSGAALLGVTRTISLYTKAVGPERRWPITHPIIDNHTSNYFGANHTSNSGTNWHHLNLVPTTPITHPIILEFRQLGV